MGISLIKSKKIVLFGAGKIGRSFIGQLFSQSGYETVFIDKDMRLIEALNAHHSYKVYICDTVPQTIIVTNVRGVSADERLSVIEEIVSAGLLAVSVGKNGLPHIVPVLAESLIRREQQFPGIALDIILAENMRDVDTFMHHALKKALPPDYPLSERVGLVETSIGKMVPLAVNTQEDNMLDVSAEAYNTLIVNKEAFINPIPEVKGIAAKENMKAWVDRKLFIHNFGHAATAYMGYLLHPGYSYVWEVLEDKSIRLFVREAMQQASAVLRTIHPGVFTEEELQEHIDDLLRRFANKSLGDTVFRVGCDLYRKLSPDDRIVPLLQNAYHHQLPYDKIVKVLSAALRFKACDQSGQMLPSDIAFHKELENTGKEGMVRHVCGITNVGLVQHLTDEN
jgi:mannitol-1-phosphate 5-dehydrogenase